MKKEGKKGSFSRGLFLWCAGRGPEYGSCPSLCVCVCVCVCERDRKTERERERETNLEEERGQVAPLFHPYNPIQTHSHKLTCSSSS